MKTALARVFLPALLALGLAPQASWAAQLGINQLACYQVTDRFAEDEVYFIVSVARADGSSFAYRVPETGSWSMSPRTRPTLQSLLLWQEPLLFGQRALVTVTMLEDDGDGPGKGIQVGQAIAQAVAGAMQSLGGPRFPAGAMMLGSLDLRSLSEEVERLAHGLDDDDRMGQFVVELHPGPFGFQTQFRALGRATGTATGPFNAWFDLTGDGAYYRALLGANP